MRRSAVRPKISVAANDSGREAATLARARGLGRRDDGGTSAPIAPLALLESAVNLDAPWLKVSGR